MNNLEKRKDIGKYTIGFFHRFNKQKDIETFFKACKTFLGAAESERFLIAFIIS